jgi:hypothetical protein
MVVAYSCLFDTLFLFDTLGDAVGFEGAYWVLIVVPLTVVTGVLAVHLISMQSGTGERLQATLTPVAMELPILSPLTATAYVEDAAC